MSSESSVVTNADPSANRQNQDKLESVYRQAAWKVVLLLETMGYVEDTVLRDMFETSVQSLIGDDTALRVMHEKRDSRAMNDLTPTIANIHAETIAALLVLNQRRGQTLH